LWLRHRQGQGKPLCIPSFRVHANLSIRLCILALFGSGRFLIPSYPDRKTLVIALPRRLDVLNAAFWVATLLGVAVGGREVGYRFRNAPSGASRPVLSPSTRRLTFLGSIDSIHYQWHSRKRDSFNRPTSHGEISPRHRRQNPRRIDYE